MLLLDPPFPIEEWRQANCGDAAFQRAFCQYCRQYEAEVLSLPAEQLAKVENYLIERLEHCEFTPQILHVIVEREVCEREFESSNKVIRLIVLRAMVRLLEDAGFSVLSKTRRLLDLGDELIPEVLVLAVNDHFGLLQVTAE